MVKRCRIYVQNYIYWVKKRFVWVVLEYEEIRDKDNKTGLKERGVIEMSTTVLPFAMLALFAFVFTYLLVFISYVFI